MPIIPITIQGHRTWVFVDSGTTFTILSVDDAHRTGIFDQFQVCFNNRARKVTLQKL
ncbi:MAG: hypothetical protein HZB32_04685 [Nitrospirae bacterium]|nr:hypothetical protein [Nitrospirota bacterium]